MPKAGAGRGNEGIAKLLIAKGADLDPEFAENGQELLLSRIDNSPRKVGLGYLLVGNQPMP